MRGSTAIPITTARAISSSAARSTRFAKSWAGVADQHPGEVIGISLVRKHQRWVYKFKILTADGTLQEVSVDAKSMDVIREESGN